MIQPKTLTIIVLLVFLFIGCQSKQHDSEPQIRSIRAFVEHAKTRKTETGEQLNTTSFLSNANNSIKAKVLKKRAAASPVSKFFTTGTADTIEVLGAKLCVPAGSLVKNRSLSITPLNTDELPIVPSGLVNVTAGAAGFRFLPHGEHFKELAASVIIPFDTLLIPQGYTTKDIRTYYFDEMRSQWVALPTDTVFNEEGLVCALTTHFTDMINGIIQVPESPETQGYTPTSITDIKAASPATGITAMAPPTANQRGAASMSYPMLIPPGRKGMQPSVALQYSSEAQSGWVGYGWSLTMPSVDIDTRWGVPLFDPNIETETYIIMGEQFTEQAHHNPNNPRTNNKQFYPRIEGNFSIVIRHGNSPKNYWWEMTDKSGTKHFFGGRGNEPDEQAIVRNTDGNIVHWALTETRNVYGDFVSYSYELTNGYLYPVEIRYTGNGNNQGSHRVIFDRYADEEKSRRDITSTGRLGFMQINDQQLNEIQIFFGQELVRSYRLNYDEGVFVKNMLTSVTQLDNEGNPFSTHIFEYYNDVENGLYGNAEKWNSGDDATLKKLFTDKEGFRSNMSAINGAYTSGKRYGGGVMIGVGGAITNVSAGVSLEYSKSQNTGLVTLIDINGDGLPDKVFITDGDLCYRPNISNRGIKGEEFGDKVIIGQIGLFSYSESSSSSRIINGAVGINFNISKKKAAKAGVGISHSKEKSTDKIKIYFADFNGDGLPDIANNGRVYFNYIDENGHPKFEASSALTPNPIAGTDMSIIDNDFKPDYNAERDSLEKEFPLHDVVRLWRAPYTGIVALKGDIELTASAIEWQEYDGTPDGIIASIQQEGKLLWKDSITAFGGVLKPNIDALEINAGERILFRLQSRYSGALDEVSWSPAIRYDSIFAEVDTLDENNINRYNYSAENDFVFSGNPSVILAKGGTVEVLMPYTKKTLCDDISLVVEQYNTLSDLTTELFRKTLLAGEKIIDAHESLTINVAQNDTVQLFFRIEAGTPVDWSAITWKPVVKYISAEESIYVAPEMVQMFNKHVYLGKKHQIYTQTKVNADPDPDLINGIDTDLASEIPFAPDDFIPDPSNLIATFKGSAYLPQIKAVPFLNIKEFEDKDSIITTVKLSLRTNTSIFMNINMNIDGFQLIGDTLDIEAGYENENVLATYFVGLELKEVNEAGLKLFREKIIKTTEVYPNPQDLTQNIKIDRIDTIFVECDTIRASVYSIFNRIDLGHLYRGWGQFAWNGSVKPYEVLSPSDFVYDKNKYKELKTDDMLDGDAMEGGIGSEALFTMFFNAEKGSYQSISEQAYINGTHQSSSRIGSLEIVVDSINFPTGGGSLAAPVQRTESVTRTTSATGSFASKLGSNVSYSKSKMESLTEVSVMDLNGDRYPDWIKKHNGQVKTQYTSNTGALSNFSIIHPFGVSKTEGEANCIAGSASYDPDGVPPVPSKEERKAIRVVAKAAFSGNLKKILAESQFGAKEGSQNPSISGNYSRNRDDIVREWLDVNGDGLPDMVFNNGTVQYNTGYGFTEPIAIGHTGIRKNTSNTVGGGGGVSISIQGSVDVTFGISFSFSQTDNNLRLIDINGDGLPDMLNDGKVAFNTGSGFDNFVSWKDGIMTRSKSTSTSIHGNIAFPIAIPLTFITLSVTPSVILANSQGVSRTLSDIMDINGDGYPDIIESDQNNELYVRLNQMGRTNLLKTVQRPFGGTINLDYQTRGNTYNHPQSKTVLVRVDVQTNMPENGATRMSSAFDYVDGYYDRYERDFWGFAKVITRQLDTQNDDKVYRTVTETYNNKSFVTKNLLQSQVLTDAAGNEISTTAHFYKFVPQAHDAKSVFTALDQKVSEIREPESTEVMRSAESYEYDAIGNVVKYTSSVSGADITSHIGYHSLADKYIMNVPKSISVTTADGEMRKRETDVDALGNITQIRQHNSSYVAKYDLAYDAYGNLTRVTRPENYKGERMWYQYTYDDVLHTLVTSVTDAFGYTSSTQYNYKWAAPVETIDINGNRMVYTYDNHGRMTGVTAPYELDAGHPYTIAFEYNTNAPVPYARTAHYDAHTGGNIETYTFVDALMRPVQVKKSGVVYTNGADERVMIVSGRVKYDAFGRAVEAYQPVTEPMDKAAVYSTVTDNVAPAVTQYDVQDRAVKVTLPDGATSTTAYTLAQHLGETMLQTTVTDALGRKAFSFADGRGRTRTTVQTTNGSDVAVNYGYNLIGELLEVTHPNSHKTIYTYDKLGRRLSVNHPDAGLTTFEYDNANNLRKKQTPNLRKEIQDGGYITYEYEFERLHEVLYPKNIFNRVTYTYGQPGADHNRAARLTLVEDGSGGEAYYYGKMGEITKTVKTIMLSLSDIRTYVWAAQYDSWNRVQNMTYPDGEKVSYIYNTAGNLQSMVAQKNDDNYLFIAHQGYDKFEQLVYRKAGNGTETTYNYDPLRQRLHNMTLKAKGSELMNNTYSYDAVDNILGITNTSVPQGDIGGSYAHTYNYDDLNRLVSAAGSSKGADYALNMNYDAMGNILKKEQTVNGSTVASSHVFNYLYEGTKPNAATMIGNHRYTYDENGNPIMREDTASNTFRQMVWDEENRLAMLSDNGYTSRYTYNHGGERVIKSHGGTTGVYINGNPQGILYHDADNYTAYVSPYMVVNKDRFTKHYYTGTQRVASKIGVGKFNNLYQEGGSSITAGQKDYAARMALIEQERSNYYATMGIPPGPPTSKGIFGEPEYAGKALPNNVLGNYNIPANWPQPPVKNQPGQVPGPPVMYGPPVKPNDVKPGYGYTLPLPIPEDDIYFYHTDHLGSTSYITDAEANPTQFVCYMPFGQAFVDEHTTRAEMPFKFNGKEQDSETGLYYYGARYYDPMVAVWYGVDPLAEKMPAWGGYVYCFSNPVRFIDPTGMEGEEPENKKIGEGQVSRFNNYANQNIAKPREQRDDCITTVINGAKALFPGRKIPAKGTLNSLAISWQESGIVGEKNEIKFIEPAGTRPENLQTSVAGKMIEATENIEGTYMFIVGMMDGYHTATVSIEVTDKGNIFTFTDQHYNFKTTNEGLDSFLTTWSQRGFSYYTNRPASKGGPIAKPINNVFFHQYNNIDYVKPLINPIKNIKL